MQAWPRVHALRLPAGAWRFPRGLWLTDQAALGDRLLAVLASGGEGSGIRGAVELETPRGRYRVSREPSDAEPRVDTLDGAAWPEEAAWEPVQLLPDALRTRRRELALHARTRALQAHLLRIERELQRARDRLARGQAAQSAAGEVRASLACRLRAARLGLSGIRRATAGSLQQARDAQAVLKRLVRELRDPEALRDLKPVARELRAHAETLDADTATRGEPAQLPAAGIAIPVAALAGGGVLGAGLVTGLPGLALLGVAALAPAAWSGTRWFLARRAAPAEALTRREALQTRAFELLRQARVLPQEGAITGDHLRVAAERVEARERTATVREALRALLPSEHERRRAELRVQLLTTEALPPELQEEFQREPLLQVAGILSGLAQDLELVIPQEVLRRRVERLERRREACVRLCRMASRAASALLLEHLEAGHAWPLFLSAATVAGSPQLQRALHAAHGRLPCPVVIEAAGPDALRRLLEALPRELAFHLRPLPVARLRRRARAAAEPRGG